MKCPTCGDDACLSIAESPASPDLPYFRAFAGLHDHVSAEETQALEWAAYREVHDVWRKLESAVWARGGKIAMQIARERNEASLTALEKFGDDVSGVSCFGATVVAYTRDSREYADPFSTTFPIELMALSDAQLAERRLLFDLEVEKARQASIQEAKDHADASLLLLEQQERMQLARLYNKYGPPLPAGTFMHVGACQAKFNPSNRCTCSGAPK